MSPANLPDGEWLCHSCRPAPSKLEGNSNLLRPLLLQAYSENPQQFFLPDDIVTMATIPGTHALTGCCCCSPLHFTI